MCLNSSLYIFMGMQHEVNFNDQPWGLSPKEKILSQYLTENGYVTGAVGK